jgi:hypothetical protein
MKDGWHLELDTLHDCRLQKGMAADIVEFTEVIQRPAVKMQVQKVTKQ